MRIKGKDKGEGGKVRGEREKVRDRKGRRKREFVKTSDTKIYVCVFFVNENESVKGKTKGKRKKKKLKWLFVVFFFAQNNLPCFFFSPSLCLIVGVHEEVVASLLLLHVLDRGQLKRVIEKLN